MPERIQLSGSPEEAAAQLCEHLGLDKMQPYTREKDLEELNLMLIETLEKMKQEREDIFEKNSALEDACGKLMKEKMYLQQQLVKAINYITEQQKDFQAALTELQAQAMASSPSDP